MVIRHGISDKEFIFKNAAGRYAVAVRGSDYLPESTIMEEAPGMVFSGIRGTLKGGVFIHEHKHSRKPRILYVDFLRAPAYDPDLMDSSDTFPCEYQLYSYPGYKRRNCGESATRFFKRVSLLKALCWKHCYGVDDYGRSPQEEISLEEYVVQRVMNS